MYMLFVAMYFSQIHFFHAYINMCASLPVSVKLLHHQVGLYIV